jgi:hypothetical protein
VNTSAADHSPPAGALVEAAGWHAGRDLAQRQHVAPQLRHQLGDGELRRLDDQVVADPLGLALHQEAP